MKRMLIASTSTVHGSSFLEYMMHDLSKFFENTTEILFLPYARPSGISHVEYTQKVNEAFNKIGKFARGIHEFDNSTDSIQKAQGIFIGGGNTFVLVDQLYRHNLMAPLKAAINNGTPYLGTSAGSNICGLTISTTNDMPIVYPPSFRALGLVPFNINPHYLDPDLNSTHKGETRETRIKEFHQFNTQPVIGLREGSWLVVKGNSINLTGNVKARIFEYNKEPYEVESGTDLTSLK